MRFEDVLAQSPPRDDAAVQARPRTEMAPLAVALGLVAIVAPVGAAVALGRVSGLPVITAAVLWPLALLVGWLARRDARRWRLVLREGRAVDGVIESGHLAALSGALAKVRVRIGTASATFTLPGAPPPEGMAVRLLVHEPTGLVVLAIPGAPPAVSTIARA